MILIIDLSSQSLSRYEFVDPIVNIVKKIKKQVEVVNYKDLTEEQIEQSKAIIMCGNSLKDNTNQENFEQFNWIKDYKKPLLGICGGMQIIGLVYGATLEPQKEIGMTQIMTKNSLFDSSLISSYELHGFTVTLPEGFIAIA